MYCPQCATQLNDTAEHCHSCDLDVRPFVRLFAVQQHEQIDQQALREQWKQQRHSLGLLIVMSSLLVACMIPIAIGIFMEASYLGSVVLILAGLAGFLLILGSMLMMASEGEILVSLSRRRSAPLLETAVGTVNDRAKHHTFRH